MGLLSPRSLTAYLWLAATFPWSLLISLLFSFPPISLSFAILLIIPWVRSFVPKAAFVFLISLCLCVDLVLLIFHVSASVQCFQHLCHRSYRIWNLNYLVFCVYSTCYLLYTSFLQLSVDPFCAMWFSISRFTLVFYSLGSSDFSY